jgi:predicted RNA-binding protein YlxR (DUF448 family)
MAKKFHEAVRMCIACRERQSQKLLVRLQCKEGLLETFNNSGRSFYLCNVCIADEKKVLKALMRQCKSGNKDKILIGLKEIIPDDRES